MLLVSQLVTTLGLSLHFERVGLHCCDVKELALGWACRGRERERKRERERRREREKEREREGEREREK